MRILVRSFVLSALAPAATLGAQSLDGVWRTQGYGNVIQIQGQSLEAWEVTATTCVKSFSATRDSAATPGRMATFRGNGDVFFVRTGGNKDFHLLHSDGAASDQRIDRIAVLPAVCTPPTSDTPLNNFEVFTRTWADHYILFDQKQVDWPSLVEANRSKVSANTTPAELFDVLEGMIKPLDDAHTSLSAQALNRRFGGLRSGTDAVMKAYGGRAGFRRDGLPKIFGVVEQKYLAGPIRKWCNDQVQYGHLNDSTGYLRIISFSGFGKEPTFASGLVALEAALDTIFTDPKLKGLVIDVRINFGGADPYGLAIASRLATKEYLAYTKEARSDPADRNKWTPGDKSMVTPSSRPGFRGPVVELIGGLTISAGETFTQAMMGRTPHITRVGENTQGVFSDVLGRSMPNGWRFGLPNEVFRASDGKTFDGMGIPPDVTVAMFADADLAAGRDPGIEKALALLRSPSP